jgi:hypothetical protein
LNQKGGVLNAASKHEGAELNLIVQKKFLRKNPLTLDGTHQKGVPGTAVDEIGLGEQFVRVREGSRLNSV